ncbi:MAG TPA: FtsX-like permease family protein [Cyclobacteriaceae bacterium]|nr:FtsX-like permease family protein [Cyclobacteriaceae bacterium]
MLRNFLKIALRNITRSRGYSVINIAGLAVGMSVTMLIGMWVYDEVSFDRYHANYDRIGEIYQHQSVNLDETITLSAGCGPLGAELKANYKGDFRHVVRMWWESVHTLSIGDHKVSQNGTFMDGEVAEMLSLKMIHGDWSALIKDPKSIILSESAATALFGDQDPMDKMIRLDNDEDLKVTGVYEDLPGNTRFSSLKFISSWDQFVAANFWMKAEETNWKNTLVTLVQLQPNATFEGVSARIQNVKADHLTKDEAMKENPRLFVQPMSRWHLYSEWENGKEVRGRIQFVWLFGIIGVFVLLLACINFMNLSTAQSEKRAREVGIRKSIGSARAQLIWQFLTESFMVVLLSWFVALAFVGFLLPWFNDLAGKRMSVPWENVAFWVVSVVFILVTSLLSGSYPALFLSSFQPVKVLKGTFKAGRFASMPRKVLVVLQFTVSITLIIGTTIVWQQIQHAKNRPIGYSREGLIMVRKTTSDHWRNAKTIRDELVASGGAAAVAESAGPPTAVWFESTGFNWKGKDPNLHDDFANIPVSHDYGKTMGWEFVQGRDFDRDRVTDSLALVLNEAAVKFMGLENPLDEEITWQGQKYHVIGVIKDMVMMSPYEPVKQTIFRLIPYQGLWVNIKLNPELSTSESLARVAKVYQTLMPAVPFEYKFVDEEYAAKFSGEERIGKLATFFASLAIFISCLGLFGMASFVAEQRKKEIGIRKILGASIATVWRLLSMEFLILVCISCLIGIPISWHYLDKWLQTYDYRTDISIWVFIGATGGALFITLITVSFQTIRASIVNPINSLRSE